jgi:hypothetical protein
MGTITHKFNDAHADGADATLVRPSNWNDTHNFTLNSADLGDITATGTALVTAASQAAGRTALGLGTLATQSGTFSGTSSGTNTGDQTITLTGGVTGSGTGSFAATVVTNANLTGPITSTGNATAVASQTGSGNKFVMDTSPTLTTPIIGSYTFATLPSAASNSGATARVTDIGPATAGSLWISNGTIWKPVGGRVTLATLASRVSAAGGAAETIAHQFQLPAAFLTTLDRIRHYASVSKSGTTTTGTYTVRVGTLGTTGDAAITGTAGAVLAAANRSVGLINDFVVQSATSIGKVGVAVTAGGSYGAAAATAYAAATTISNVSNSLWVTVTVTPGATDAVALEDSLIEYVCV